MEIPNKPSILHNHQTQKYAPVIPHVLVLMWRRIRIHVYTVVFAVLWHDNQGKLSSLNLYASSVPCVTR
jgi:hypothetical protein